MSLGLSGFSLPTLFQLEAQDDRIFVTQ